MPNAGRRTFSLQTWLQHTANRTCSKLPTLLYEDWQCFSCGLTSVTLLSRVKAESQHPAQRNYEETQQRPQLPLKLLQPLAAEWSIAHFTMAQLLPRLRERRARGYLAKGHALRKFGSNKLQATVAPSFPACFVIGIASTAH